MTTIRHGGPCALRIEMRSDERGPKSVVFIGTGGRMYFGTRSERERGGVYQNFRLRCTTATFVYLSHSAVVIPFESARPLRTREKGGDESDPPKKPGGHAAPDSGTEYHTAIRPHGVALVLIYPCGKAQNSPPCPSRFIVSDRSSPSRVRFAASRPGRLRADPKDALLTRGKGGYRSASDFISHLIALDSIAPGAEGCRINTPGSIE